MNDLAAVLGLLLMILGFAGVYVPLLPGVPIMLAGAWTYSALTGWDVITWPWLLFMTLLTAGSFAFDFLAAAWVTRTLGASRRTGCTTMLGTLVGVLFLGAWGALVGGMGGAVLGEYSVTRKLKPALKSGSGAFLGFLLVMLVDTAVAIVMLTIYLMKVG